MSTASRTAPAARARRFPDAAPIGVLSTAGILSFCVLMLCVPWERLWGAPFVDRTVYLNKFAGLHPQQLYGYTGTAISFITNEVLWDTAIRRGLDTLNLPVELLFGAITFLCLFVFSKYLVSKHGLWSLVFLVNPLVVDFAFSQLRMALAVSLLLLALFYRARWIPALALTALACCIHTASFLFVFIFFASEELMRRLAGRKASGTTAWLGLLGIGAAVVAVIGPFRAAILSAIGDRRIEYDNVSESLKYASFWILLQITTATQAKKYFEIEGNAIAVAFLSVFACASLLNVYNSRFLSAAYPMIIAAMLSLSGQKKVLVLPLYALYAAVQWYFWLGAGLAP